MDYDDMPVDALLDGLDDDELSDFDDHAGDPDDREVAMLGVEVVNWRTLTDDQAPKVWATVGDWVAWFLDRYEIPDAKIPQCWWQHGNVVEELSALHTAWLVSFDSTDAGYGPIGWHERLTVSMQRIAGWYHGQCRDSHQARIITRRPRADDDTAWLAWSRTSHA